jgi:hypothetical protein
MPLDVRVQKRGSTSARNAPRHCVPPRLLDDGS